MSIDKFTPNFDFASLYPTTLRDLNDDYFKLFNRRKKLNKILNKINNGQV